MAKSLPENLTQLANDAQRDPESARQFLAAVYDILREIAQKQASNRPAPGEGATEVAHEVAADFLSPSAPMQYENRRHVLSGLVLRIGNKMIDLAKRRRRAKRGGGAKHESLDSPAVGAAVKPNRDLNQVVAVEEAFALLREQHPNSFQVLKLRNEGYKVEEVADRLDVSPKTVIRWTKFGTAFLYGHLTSNEEPAPGG